MSGSLPGHSSGMGSMSSEISSATILIVDDDPDIAGLEERVLARNGASVKVMLTVVGAVELLAQESFSVILLDHRLPGGDPWAVVKAAEARVPRIPVILVTGEGSEEIAADAIRLRVAGYVKKTPKFWETLPETVEHVIRLAQLEERNRWLAAVVESSPDAIFGIAIDGNITSWNEGAERIYGYSPEQILGKPVALLLPESRRGEMAQFVDRIRRGERIEQMETTRLHRNGKEFPVSITPFAVYGADGGIVAFSTITRDISERKTIEARLQFSDRMASVGTLATGAAHEINNPLTYVVSSLEIIAQEFQAHRKEFSLERIGEIEKYLEMAQQGATRVHNIVRGLQSFANLGGHKERRERIELPDVLELSITMASRSFSDRAQLIKDWGAAPAVYADALRLAQVFANLITNAAEAIPPGNPSGNQIVLVTRTDASGRAIVEVQDTGCGIQESIRMRIFDPFFTTKPVGAGAGLGLSICHGIVQSLDGEISFESSAESGTVFRVALPAATPAQGAGPTFGC
jgi:two-component system, NtrC family, sensor kinase